MFSLAEIDEATDGFNQSNKIGEGGYGTIYKGFICHTAVAVKVLNRGSMQGAAEFQQEVNGNIYALSGSKLTLLLNKWEAKILNPDRDFAGYANWSLPRILRSNLRVYA